MRLARLNHRPDALLEFYDQALSELGALAERTWHDRLHVVADARAAALWENSGAVIERELHFPPAEATRARDPAVEVFPGCPLTFRIAEALWPHPPGLERVALQPFESSRQPPDAMQAARSWTEQNPGAGRFCLETPFRPAWSFSLLALIRCEIQAIHQRWSVHRVAVSLSSGDSDDALAGSLEVAAADPDPKPEPPWPAPSLTTWTGWLTSAVRRELDGDVELIRAEQQRFLTRELDRLDEYFDGYERELREREARSKTDRGRYAERLSAAQADRQRRRQDQIDRHQIHVVPHWDVLILVAETAWEATVSYVRERQTITTTACYVPRRRGWSRSP